MMIQRSATTLRNFLKPDWRKILLLTLFGFVSAGGEIQTWAFDEHNPQIKPPLYDLLRPLPLWFVWIVSLLPLLWLSAFFRGIGLDPLKIGFDANLLWRIALVCYYYLLSCLLVSLFNWGKHQFTP